MNTKFLFKLNTNNKLYSKVKPFPYYNQKNILPEDFAKKCQKEILDIPQDKWDRYSNPFEDKYTLRDKTDLPPNVNELFKYLSSEYFVNHLSEIVGEKLFNDTTKNWWGIHKYDNNDHLDIHTDAGIHPITKQKKHITLGIYLSKDWKDENGGHLEVWDGDSVCSKNPKLYKCENKFLPEFNSLIIFTCNDYAYHGIPNKTICNNDEKRLFLTLSYVSEKYDDEFQNKLEKAYFIKRPEDPENKEKDRLRDLRCDPIKYKEIYNLNNLFHPNKFIHN